MCLVILWNTHKMIYRGDLDQSLEWHSTDERKLSSGVECGEINWYSLKQERGVYHDLHIIVWTVGLAVMYAGESKIICNLGTCFAVGYTAGWAWRDTHGLLLSYHCGAGATLIVHFCHEFCAISRKLRFSLAPKKSRGQWSVFFMGWRCTRC